MYRVFPITNKKAFVETDDYFFALDIAFEHFEKTGIVMYIQERIGKRWYNRTVVNQCR